MRMIEVKSLTPAEAAEQRFRQIQERQKPYQGRTKDEVTAPYSNVFNLFSFSQQYVIGTMLIRSYEKVYALRHNENGVAYARLVPFRKIPDNATYGTYVSKNGIEKPRHSFWMPEDNTL